VEAKAKEDLALAEEKKKEKLAQPVLLQSGNRPGSRVKQSPSD